MYIFNLSFSGFKYSWLFHNAFTFYIRVLGIHGGGGGLDEPDCIGEGAEISDRTKETIAGLQKNITRIITLSNEDLQVLNYFCHVT